MSNLETQVNRTVHTADALEWLKQSRVGPGHSFVTSMPDFSEFTGVTLTEWKTWFIAAARLVLHACPDDGIVMFYQTDIKVEGAWVDKGFLCETAAAETNHNLICHKIVCRAPANSVTFGRPGYSHLLGFSKNVKPELKYGLTDVLNEAGETTWTRGMGRKACELACQYIRHHTNSHTIVDPFCGHGSILLVANEFGFHSIGVEISRKRARVARNLDRL